MIFVALALAGFVVVAGAFLFGHDHDFGHDFGHDHDFSHGGEGGNEHSISIFSTKVVATFVMGFGAAGAISYYNGCTHVWASVIGIGGGVVLGLAMWGLMSFFTKQQATSQTVVQKLVGAIGIVTVPISPDSMGEVGLQTSGGGNSFFPARSCKAISKGRRARVLESTSSVLTVEEIV